MLLILETLAGEQKMISLVWSILALASLAHRFFSPVFPSSDPRKCGEVDTERPTAFHTSQDSIKKLFYMMVHTFGSVTPLQPDQPLSRL